MKVFLGGTCSTSKWRDLLIPKLKIDYFNPVVDNSTSECLIEELRQREICDICLYVITPRMAGYYSIAEVVDDSNKRPKKTIMCVLEEDNAFTFDDKEMKSFKAIGNLVLKNGGLFFNSLDDVSLYLNSLK